MPKIIVKIKHLKTSKSVGNFVNYIAKRDSVDMSLNQKVLVGKPTKKQVDFIDKMLEEYDVDREKAEADIDVFIQKVRDAGKEIIIAGKNS